MKKSRKFVAVIVLIAYCLTFAPSNTAFASNACEVSVITGFKSLPAEERVIKISERDKLTLQQIMDIRPVAKPQKYSQRRSPCIMRLNVI